MRECSLGTVLGCKELFCKSKDEGVCSACKKISRGHTCDAAQIQVVAESERDIVEMTDLPLVSQEAT